jgi:hypothetical protein
MCTKPERDGSGRLVRGTANPRGASVPWARLARLIRDAQACGAEVIIRVPTIGDEPAPPVAA